MHDLIIVGAGPAGLAASLYAARKRLDFLTICETVGGKSNYRVHLADSDETQVIQAGELVAVYRSRLESLRHSYRTASVTSVTAIDGGFSVSIKDGDPVKARAVIIASGTRNRRLKVDGESQFLSRGLGYSSISYSHLLSGKRVFLTGDSDRAVNSAIELSLHATEVSLALLAGGTFTPALIDRASALERITLLRNATVVGFEGDGFARRVIVESEGSKQTLEADGFFLEPEPSPNTGFVGDLVELDARGYIPVNGMNEASRPGVFAAGDVTGNGFEQVLVSLGEGTKALLSAYRFLLESGTA